MQSGRVQKKKLSRIEIPLPSKPRPYRPGDGPALAPITLTLKQDSGAFIVDKRVQPGKPAANGDLKLEMYYVVGWPDLPAGRVVINARRIYDYVSPRTLEDFEYKLSLERERAEEEEEQKQRQKKEKEAKRKKAEAEALATAVAKAQQAAAAGKATPLQSSTHATAATPTTPTTGKRGRGRPSKADLLARQMAQQTSVDENAEVSLPPTSISGPSLSTPKKKQLAAVGVVSEVDTDVQDELEEEEDEGEADLEEDDIDPNDAIFQQLYSEATAVEEGRKESDTKRVMENEIPLRTVRRDPSPSHKAPPPSKPANGKLKQSTPVRPQPQLQTSQNGSTSGPKTAPVQKTTLQHYGFTPAARSSGKWPLRGPSAGPNDTPTTKALPERNNTTVETPTSASSAKPPRKRKRTASSTAAADQEPLFEVKQLEGDRVDEADDGTRTRFFKVRWKGHWPADQNPTWEPEENISRKLVREYLRRKSSKSSKSGGSSRNSPATAAATPKVAAAAAAKRPSLLARKYSSVAEAFDGAAEVDESSVSGRPSRANSSARGGGGRDDADAGDHPADDEEDFYGNDDDGDVDLLVVTDQPQRKDRWRSEHTSPASSSGPALPSLPSLPRERFDAMLTGEPAASFGRSGDHQQRHRQQQQPNQSSES